MSQDRPRDNSSLRTIGSHAEERADASEDSGLLPRVTHTIAVASGKGGVGKSTVAVNLAVALARSGASVGLLDADIHGPSVPLMLGAGGTRPQFDEDAGKMRPIERFGVRFMSLGSLTDPESAVVWRGPLVMKAIKKFLREVEWGKLDFLVVDLPPGTGDAQLSLSQLVRLAGAVIVTTPQDVALADAIKGVSMFRKVEVPVLGIVENMSYFQCPNCSSRTDVFGHGGGKEQAQRLGIPFLGEIPLERGIRAAGDAGEPIASSVFGEIADSIRRALDGY
jgi:ATP-binding protein involved in chromosome partitioning